VAASASERSCIDSQETALAVWPRAPASGSDPSRPLAGARSYTLGKVSSRPEQNPFYGWGCICPVFEKELPSGAPRGDHAPMKTYRKELWFEVPARRAFINITPQVEAALRESGIQEGIALVNAMHISASVFINDDESGLHADFERWLEKLAPEKPHSQYAHNRGEDNADAHLKRTIMGREVVVAVTGGRLDFGPWEQIFYGEFDGLRRKRVLVKIIGE